MSVMSLSTFRRRLKTYLFQRSHLELVFWDCTGWLRILCCIDQL